MIAIGILLVLAALGGAAIVATGGRTPAEATFGAFHLENTTAFFFFSGAFCSAVLLIGVWFLIRGYVRWRDRSRELQRLRMRAADGPEPYVPVGAPDDDEAAEIRRPSARSAGSGEPRGSHASRPDDPSTDPVSSFSKSSRPRDPHDEAEAATS